MKTNKAVYTVSVKEPGQESYRSIPAYTASEAVEIAREHTDRGALVVIIDRVNDNLTK